MCVGGGWRSVKLSGAWAGNKKSPVSALIESYVLVMGDSRSSSSDDPSRISSAARNWESLVQFIIITEERTSSFIPFHRLLKQVNNVRMRWYEGLTSGRALVRF